MSALLLDDMSAWPHLVAFYQANNIINLLREGSVLIDPCIHDVVAGRAGIHNRFLLSTSCHRLSHLAWIVTLDDPLDITSTPCRQGMLKSPSAPRYTGGRALAFIAHSECSASPLLADCHWWLSTHSHSINHLSLTRSPLQHMTCPTLSSSSLSVA